MSQAELQNGPDTLSQVIAIGASQPVFCGVPFGEQLCRFTDGAAVAGIMAKDSAQLDEKDGNLGFDALRVGDVPELANFVGSQGTGIESVFAGVMVALLAASFSFCFRGSLEVVHVAIIAHMFYE